MGVRTGRADRELSWAPGCQAQPCLLRDSPPFPSPASASWVVCTQREHDWGWFGSVQILFISEQACFYVQDGDLRNHTQHREECPSLSTARRGFASSPGPSTSSAQGLHQAALKPVGASKEAANSQAPDLWLLQDGTSDNLRPGDCLCWGLQSWGAEHLGGGTVFSGSRPSHLAP